MAKEGHTLWWTFYKNTMTSKYRFFENKNQSLATHGPIQNSDLIRPRLRLTILTGLEHTAQLAFGTLVLLALVTPSWRYGPFAWFPLGIFPELAGGPVAFGIFNLLPVFLLISWLAGRFFNAQWRPESLRSWRWGSCRLTIPLLALTILGLLSLDPILDRRTLVQVGGLFIFWLLYLYVLNERPRLLPILLLVGTIQGTVAVAQFWQQTSLGLAILGELPLNPIHEGVSVLWARGVPWLRAYGLTAHPNLLGAILTVVLLFLLPAVPHTKSRRLVILILAITISFVGLLLSFSRAAILGLVAGMITWIMLGKADSFRLNSRLRRLAVGLLLLLFIALYVGYGDLLLSRVIHLDTPGEARSLSQRLDDSQIALAVINQHPLTGVGLGSYTDVAQTKNPAAARVHNVPLLVTAELGLLGGFVILWFGIGPLLYWANLRRTSDHPLPANVRMANALWVAMLVIGLFDTTLWLASNWQTAIIIALISSQMVMTWDNC